MSVTRVLGLVLGMLVFVQSLSAQESMSVLFWNVESGGNDASTIASELSQLVADEGPFDLVGLTEVRSANSDDYIEALGGNFTGIVSNSGGGDRMVIAFNEDRFNLVQSMELNEHDGIALNFFSNGRPRFRSPLVAELQEESGTRRFFFMVNHLARNNGGNSNGGFRVQQAQGLVAWAEDQELPIIMGGDLNLDFNFEDMEGNAAFSVLFGTDDSDDQEFKWIRPEPLVDSNHSGNTGTDSFPDSILDFVTVANATEGWTTTESEVIVRPGDLPDDGDTSDHRPVRAVFASGESTVNVAALLQRIRGIRRELEAMEALLEGRD